MSKKIDLGRVIGETPHIGDNGDWFIADYDTGVKAQGPKGEQGDCGPQGYVNVFVDGTTAYITTK